MSPYRLSFARYVAQTSTESLALDISHGKGAYLYDHQGKAYLDFISGLCVSNLGHGVPEILDAIQNQTQRYLHPIVYGEGIMEAQVLYAQQLANDLGEGLDVVYFTGAGAEAVEASMKLAKKYTGRRAFVSCLGAYHGSTHGALSIGGRPQAVSGYGPLLPFIRHIRFNVFEDIELIDTQTAAVIMEPIHSALGYIPPLPGYLQAVRERCNETGALFILDEIQSGMGRTGAMFACQTYDLKPDILLLAKALGGGLPLGAFICKQEIMQVLQQNPALGHISTYGGHPVSCAAGLAMYKQIRQSGVLTEVEAKSSYLVKGLQHPLIEEVRGKGLMLAAQLPDAALCSKAIALMLEQGLITIGFLSNYQALRLAPPLNISYDELDRGIETILSVLDTL